MTKSYYKIIDGNRYDRDMLEIAEEAVSGQDDERIAIDDAKKLLEAIVDGNTITEIEKNTLDYILENFEFAPAAQEWLKEHLDAWLAQQKSRKNFFNIFNLLDFSKFKFRKKRKLVPTTPPEKKFKHLKPASKISKRRFKRGRVKPIKVSQQDVKTPEVTPKEVVAEEPVQSPKVTEVPETVTREQATVVTETAAESLKVPETESAGAKQPAGDQIPKPADAKRPQEHEVSKKVDRPEPTTVSDLAEQSSPADQSTQPISSESTDPAAPADESKPKAQIQRTTPSKFKERPQHTGPQNFDTPPSRGVSAASPNEREEDRKFSSIWIVVAVVLLVLLPMAFFIGKKFGPVREDSSALKKIEELERGLSRSKQELSGLQAVNEDLKRNLENVEPTPVQTVIQKIDPMAETRKKIADALLKNLGDEFARNQIKFDQEKLWLTFIPDKYYFEGGSAVPKQSLKVTLRRIFPGLVKTLAGFDREIEVIRFQGHSSSIWVNAKDSSEAYLKNLSLSTARAEAALQYCLSLKEVAKYRGWLTDRVISSGYSDQIPLLKQNRSEDYVRSRRITIAIETALVPLDRSK